jgi:hypothetical protein
MIVLDDHYILSAHENLAFCVRDLLWKVRREILAVVVLQQGFPTQLSAKKRVYRMLNFMCGEYSVSGDNYLTLMSID